MLKNVEGHILSLLLHAWALACVCSLDLCVHRSVLAYVGLFLSLCIRGFWPMYAGSCLRTWVLIRVHEMLGRGLTLPIFTSFSTVSLLYANPTPLFVIFAPKHHCILLFYLYSCIENIMFHHFHLNQEPSVIFFFYSPHPLILIGEALTRWWSGTTSLFPKLGLTSEKRALSPSLAFCRKSLQVLLCCNASLRGGGILLIPSILLSGR